MRLTKCRSQSDVPRCFLDITKSFDRYVDEHSKVLVFLAGRPSKRLSSFTARLLNLVLICPKGIIKSWLSILVIMQSIANYLDWSNVENTRNFSHPEPNNRPTAVTAAAGPCTMAVTSRLWSLQLGDLTKVARSSKMWTCQSEVNYTSRLLYETCTS